MQSLFIIPFSSPSGPSLLHGHPTPQSLFEYSEACFAQISDADYEYLTGRRESLSSGPDCSAQQPVLRQLHLFEPTFHDEGRSAAKGFIADVCNHNINGTSSGASCRGGTDCHCPTNRGQ